LFSTVATFFPLKHTFRPKLNTILCQQPTKNVSTMTSNCACNSRRRNDWMKILLYLIAFTKNSNKNKQTKNTDIIDNDNSSTPSWVSPYCCCCWTGLGGESLATKPTAPCKSLPTIGGAFGLLAMASTAKRSSWNMFLVWGLRRDV
jgi:hypothetical protein